MPLLLHNQLQLSSSPTTSTNLHELCINVTHVAHVLEKPCGSLQGLIIPASVDRCAAVKAGKKTDSVTLQMEQS